MDSADDAHGRHPFVVAHRGASAERPEHTLAAYELALQEGADGVECDVRLTHDGHLVCVHDRRIDRMVAVIVAISVSSSSVTLLASIITAVGWMIYGISVPLRK